MNKIVANQILKYKWCNSFLIQKKAPFNVTNFDWSWQSAGNQHLSQKQLVGTSETIRFLTKIKTNNICV